MAKKSDKAKTKKPSKTPRAAKTSAAKAASGDAAPKKRGPGRPRKKVEDGRRPAGTTLEKAVELAEKKDGVTFSELMAHMGSKTKGPMVRSINSGVERGVLAASGEERGGETVYVLGSVSIDAPRPARKRKSKPKAEKLKLESVIAERAAAIGADGPHIPLEWVVAFNRAFEAFVRELASSSER